MNSQLELVSHIEMSHQMNIFFINYKVPTSYNFSTISSTFINEYASASCRPFTKLFKKSLFMYDKHRLTNGVALTEIRINVLSIQELDASQILHFCQTNSDMLYSTFPELHLNLSITFALVDWNLQPRRIPIPCIVSIL